MRPRHRGPRGAWRGGDEASCKRALSEGCVRERIHDSLPPLRVGGNAEIHGADLLDRPPRSPILRPNDEQDSIDRLERVSQHQALHLAVVSAAPVATPEKRPTDFYHALCGVEAMIT